MTWEEQLKVEKGMMGKIASLIKRMKDASFERKIRKFLKNNLIVEYKESATEDDYIHTRTTDRDKSLKEAKELFLDIVEKAWDKQFPEKYYQMRVFADDEMWDAP
jgi:short subunit dehydrogenase-like uncharacterized protein